MYLVFISVVSSIHQLSPSPKFARVFSTQFFLFLFCFDKSFPYVSLNHISILIANVIAPYSLPLKCIVCAYLLFIIKQPNINMRKNHLNHCFCVFCILMGFIRFRVCFWAFFFLSIPSINEKYFIKTEKEKCLRHAIQIMTKLATMTDKETKHEKSPRKIEKKGHVIGTLNTFTNIRQMKEMKLLLWFREEKPWRLKRWKTNEPQFTKATFSFII